MFRACRFALAVPLALTICLALPAVRSACGSLVLTLDDPLTLGIEVIVADDELAGFVTDSGLTTTVDDQDPTPGVVAPFSADTNVGDFVVSFVSAGFSNRGVGIPFLDAFIVVVETLAAGELAVGLTETDFDPLGGAGPWVLTSEIGGDTASRLSFLGGFDPANREFTVAAANGPVSPLGPGPFGAALQTPLASPARQFSLTVGVSVTANDAGEQTTFDANTYLQEATVPEPSAMVVWAGLAALLPCAWALRRWPIQAAGPRGCSS